MQALKNYSQSVKIYLEHTTIQSSITFMKENWLMKDKETINRVRMMNKKTKEKIKIKNQNNK